MRPAKPIREFLFCVHYNSLRIALPGKSGVA
jgi:hypothetical protein